MSEIGKHKLTDALPKHNEDKGGKPEPTHETAAEQVREGNESQETHDVGVVEVMHNGGGLP